MCYNCGCGIKDDPMGRGHIHEGGASLTESAFKYISDKWGVSVDEAKNETFKLLKKELEDKK